MPTEIKQCQRYCRSCERKTLHVATVKTIDMGCGFWALNLLACVVTFGLWLPVFVLILGVGACGNSFAPLGAKYLCQICGRKN